MATAAIDRLSRVRKESPVDVLWQEILDELGPLEPKLERLIRRSIQAARERADADDIQAMIANGQFDEAVTAILGYHTGDLSSFLSLRTAVEAAALEFGRQAAEGKFGALPFAVGGTFDALSPEVVTAIRQDTMASVAGITAQTGAALKQSLLNAVGRGLHPDEAAREMRSQVGLNQRDVTALETYRRELEAKANGGSHGNALGRQLRDARFDASVRSGNLDQTRIDRMVSRYSDRLLAARTRNIARTEANRALNLGQHAAWIQMANRAGVPEDAITRFWLVFDPCDECRQIASMNRAGVGLREPFQTPDGPMMLPPVHTCCRCATTISVDEEAAAGHITEREAEDIEENLVDKGWMFDVLTKYNHNHDARGRFASGSSDTPQTPVERDLNTAKQSSIAEQHRALMDEAERTGVRGYSRGYDEAINSAMRGQPKFQDHFPNLGIVREGLASAIKKTTLPHAMTLYRGIGGASGAKVGDVLSDKGYLSTSASERIAVVKFAMPMNGREATLLRIEAPRGTPALAVHGADTMFPKEHEVIFPPGTRLRVTGVLERRDHHGAYRIVHARVIP